MSFIRSCISRSVFLLGAGVAVAAQAEVRIDGPIEYGVRKPLPGFPARRTGIDP